MQTEYIQWKAYHIVKACFNSNLSLNSHSKQELTNNIFRTDNPRTHGTIAGGVYSVTVGFANLKVDCNTIGEIETYVIKQLGIDSVNNLAQILEENSGKSNPSRDEARSALQKYMEDNDLGGKGASGVNDLSEAAKFWYWTQVYRWSEDKSNSVGGDFGTCGGVFSDEAIHGSKDTQGIQVPGGLHWYKEENGRFVPRDYEYAHYNMGTGRRLAGLDDSVSASTSGTDLGGMNPTCREVAQALTTTRRDNYIGRLNRARAENPDANITPTAGGIGDGEVTNPGESCESSGGNLSWLLCSLIDLGDGIVRTLDDALMKILTVPNSYLEDPSLEKAWVNLRNIAYIILVPIFLVMVIGTALGFDFISAYTVKRALPRLVIAALFIALSFEITKFLVVLTNDVGTGIYGIITSAVSDEPITLSRIFAPSGGEGALAAGGLLIGAGIAFAVGSIGVILSYLFVMILGLGIGFFLLALRQFLVIALMIVAPLAILAWIFPGNDKLWKIWWGSFSKLLLLYPMIMLLLAVGRSFALIVSQVHN